MKRDELKAKLPHGAVNQIAAKANVNRITVYNWLNGKSDNPLVEIAVLELVAELEEKKNALYARINPKQS